MTRKELQRLGYNFEKTKSAIEVTLLTTNAIYQKLGYFRTHTLQTAHHIASIPLKSSRPRQESIEAANIDYVKRRCSSLSQN